MSSTFEPLNYVKLILSLFLIYAKILYASQIFPSYSATVIGNAVHKQYWFNSSLLGLNASQVQNLSNCQSNHIVGFFFERVRIDNVYPNLSFFLMIPVLFKYHSNLNLISFHTSRKHMVKRVVQIHQHLDIFTEVQEAMTEAAVLMLPLGTASMLSSESPVSVNL